MPRRRLLDPSFTDDIEVAQLTRDERLFLLGCLRNADDDGRLMANPAFLKAEIFMYDDDIDLKQMRQIKESTLQKMQGWRQDNIWRLVPYQNSDLEYLYFPNWFQFNKPSHPTASKLPAPPEALPHPSGVSPAPLPNTTRAAPEAIESASALSQVSLSQDRLGKVREVQEDFRSFSDNKNDLTDFLTKTLTSYMSARGERGPPEEMTPARAAQWGMLVLERFWEQLVGGKLPGLVWHGAYNALQNYPAEVVAKAFVKASPYKGGKHKSWKYVETIIKEEMEKRG